MARSRNIKPGFFKNEGLAELPYETRLLFIGLWTLADREGFLEDRPKRIKMEIFPGDNVDIERGLEALHASRFIHRYEADGRRYIAILKFHKHQSPHWKEPGSTIPKPETWASLISGDAPDFGGDDNEESPGPSGHEYPESPGLSSEACVKHESWKGGQAALIPDSGFPPKPPQPGNGKRTRRRLPATAPPDTFDLTDERIAWAVAQGLPDDRIETETVKMLNHFKGKGEMRSDWVATWRNWVIKAVEISRGARP